MAARGTPVVAVYDGSIYRFSTSSLGGYTIYYQDNSGNIYYYAHLRRLRRRCSRRRPPWPPASCSATSVTPATPPGRHPISTGSFIPVAVSETRLPRNPAVPVRTALPGCNR